MKLSLLIVSASVATAGAFSQRSVAAASRSSSTTSARHATIEKQETELIKPKSVAELMSQTDETMNMYGINVQKTYG
jgi:hypothetical protein